MGNLYYGIYVTVVIVIAIIVIIITEKYNTKSNLIIEKEKEIEKSINERTLLFDHLINSENTYKKEFYSNKIRENYNRCKELFIELKQDEECIEIFDREILLLEKILSYNKQSNRKKLVKEITNFSNVFSTKFSDSTLHQELTKDNTIKFYKTILDNIEENIDNPNYLDEKFIKDNKPCCKYLSKLLSQY